MKNKITQGHLSALLTILIWGTTFISTKVLLIDFKPIEILLFRFLLGFAALLPICPRRLKGTTRRQELTFAAAGLCGVCLYYLLENIALTFTTASAVGIIISTAPFFTALLSRFTAKEENKLSAQFFVGFAVAIVGIALISCDDLADFNLTDGHAVIGDLLALLAAFVWAVYSILTKKISSFGFNTILTTRRIFFYGILFMLPTVLFGFSPSLARLTNYVNLLNLLFLGLGASAMCFVTWNFAVKVLGAVKTSIYIYMVPVITLIASLIILKESITVKAAVGAALTLAGLFLSEKRFRGNLRK